MIHWHLAWFVLLAGPVDHEPRRLDPPATAPAPAIARAAADVVYGPHPRQVLDFWRAPTSGPAPVVVLIHGGGWVNGDKSGYRGAVKRYLDAGVSVVAINYRFVTEADRKGVMPPVRWPIEDAARAIQFVRSRAKDWNIDPKRIGATGGSAGGCSSLWLAFHDDLADPTSDDPVARESTRLFCVAVTGAQTTLDPKILREWMPNARYGGHAFGVRTAQNRDGAFQRFLEARDKLLPWIEEYSPMMHASKDDPPVFLEYPAQKKPPVKGEAQDDPTHSALLGLMLVERLKSLEVEHVLVYPGRPHERYKTSADFLIDRLTAPPAGRQPSIDRVGGRSCFVESPGPGAASSRRAEADRAGRRLLDPMERHHPAPPRDRHNRGTYRLSFPPAFGNLLTSCRADRTIGGSVSRKPAARCALTAPATTPPPASLPPCCDPSPFFSSA